MKHFSLLVWVFALAMTQIQLPALAADFSSETQSAINELVSQQRSYQEEAKMRPFDLEEEPVLTQQEEKPAVSEEDATPFFVSKINLEGNTIFSANDLEPYVKNFENHESSLADLKKLTELITNHYRSRGFVTSRAYLPPQEIDGGVVKIQIVEGKIGRVRVEGNKFYKTVTYESAVHLPKDRILRYPEMEKSLIFLNQKQGRQVRGFLEAGELPDTTDIVLKTEEEHPVYLYYVFHNRGSKLTHRARHEVHFDHDNFLGHEDMLQSDWLMAQEGGIGGGSVSYSFPFESTGTTIGFDASYTESLLLKQVKSFEVKGESLSVTPRVTQRLIRELAYTVDLSAQFEFKDSKTLVDDSKISFDRMRVLVVGPRLNFFDSGGKSFLSGEAHWGIPDFLGSLDEVDEKATRTNAGGDFIYYTGSAGRIQRLPSPFSYMIARVNGQWSKDNLTSLEQFQAGGQYSVRGYPESESLGDYGYNSTLEIYAPLVFDSVKIVGFIDAAKTYQRERAFETTTKDKFLLGAGVGVRVDLGRNFYFQADLGFPIGDPSTDEDNPIIHLSLRSGF